MGGIFNEPSEGEQKYTFLEPDYQKKLKESLIGQMTGRLQGSVGATPYTGPLTTPVNDMNLRAATLVSQLMGYPGYKQQSPGTYTNPNPSTPWNWTRPDDDDNHEDDEDRDDRDRRGDRGDAYQLARKW